MSENQTVEKRGRGRPKKNEETRKKVPSQKTQKKDNKKPVDSVVSIEEQKREKVVKKGCEEEVESKNKIPESGDQKPKKKGRPKKEKTDKTQQQEEKKEDIKKPDMREVNKSEKKPKTKAKKEKTDTTQQQEEQKENVKKEDMREVKDEKPKRRGRPKKEKTDSGQQQEAQKESIKKPEIEDKAGTSSEVEEEQESGVQIGEEEQIDGINREGMLEIELDRVRESEAIPRGDENSKIHVFDFREYTYEEKREEQWRKTNPQGRQEKKCEICDEGCKVYFRMQLQKEDDEEILVENDILNIYLCIDCMKDNIHTGQRLEDGKQLVCGKFKDNKIATSRVLNNIYIDINYYWDITRNMCGECDGEDECTKCERIKTLKKIE